MIKECKVISNNDAVTVVRFGDTDVQLPSIAKDAKTVNVEYNDGKYSVVGHAEKTESEVIEESETTKPLKIDVKRHKKTIKKKLDDEVEN